MLLFAYAIHSQQGGIDVPFVPHRGSHLLTLQPLPAVLRPRRCETRVLLFPAAPF